MPGADGFKQFIQGTLRWHPRKRASAYDLTRNPWLFFRGFREEEIEPRWIAPILNDREKRTLRIKKRELELERAELARRMGMRTGPSAGPAGGDSGGGAGPGPGLGPAPGTTSTTHGAAPGGTGSTEASTADAARMSGGSQGPATGGAAAAAAATGSGKASGDRRGAGWAPMDSGEAEGGVSDLTAASARGEGGAPMRTGSRSSTVPGSGSGSGSGAPMRTESEGSTVAGSGSGPCEPMDSGEGTAAAAGEHMDHFRSGSDVLRKLAGGGGGTAPPSGAFRVLPSLSAAQLGLLPHVGLEGVTSADALSRFPEAISRVSRIRSARRLDHDKPIMSLVQLTVGAPDLGIEVMPAAAATDDVEGGTKEEDAGADDAAAPTASPAATEEAHGTSESTGTRSTATSTTEAATAAESSKPSSSPPSPPDDEPALPEWFGEMSELEQVDVLDRAADGTDSTMEVEVVEVRARAGAADSAPGVAVVGRLLEGSGKSSVMDVIWAVKFAMEAKNVPGSAGSAGAGTGGDPGSA